MNKSQNILKDNWVLVALCPAIAFTAVHLGNDNTFLQLLYIPSYYTDILFALCCCYATVFYLKYLYKKFNKYVEWDTFSADRLIKQTFSGVILPTFLIISLEVCYLFFFLDISLSNSSVFYLELPLTILFLLILNLIYNTLYTQAYLHNKIAPETYIRNEPGGKEEKIKTITVNAGVNTLVIPITELAYFMVTGKTTFVTTINGDKYIYNVSLDKLVKLLPTTGFFRLNRQIIAARNAISGYQRTASRKLAIQLKPATGAEIYVSKTNAGAFQQWLGQVSGPLQA